MKKSITSYDLDFIERLKILSDDKISFFFVFDKKKIKDKTFFP